MAGTLMEEIEINRQICVLPDNRKIDSLVTVKNVSDRTTRVFNVVSYDNLKPGEAVIFRAVKSRFQEGDCEWIRL